MNQTIDFDDKHTSARHPYTPQLDFNERPIVNQHSLVFFTKCKNDFLDSYKLFHLRFIDYFAQHPEFRFIDVVMSRNGCVTTSLTRVYEQIKCTS